MSETLKVRNFGFLSPLVPSKLSQFVYFSLIFCKSKHRWLWAQKIYKMRQTKQSQFVYFSLVLREREETKTIFRTLPAPHVFYPPMPLSTTLSGKSICYTSTSVPSLARLQRLLEAGNSARYLRTSWGRARVRNPCQKIARSEDYKSSKIFIWKLQYPPEHSWNKVSGII